MTGTIDKRRQIVAAQLVLAVKLPYPFDAAARLMQLAADVAPGLTMDQVEINGQLSGLRRAKALLDQLVIDAEAEAERDGQG